jgi:hypothetical protein
VKDREVFQLGSNGPLLQIFFDEAPGETRSATIDSFDPRAFDFLDIDRHELTSEVTKIAASDAFQRLKNESLRQRQSDRPAGNQDENQPFDDAQERNAQ